MVYFAREGDLPMCRYLYHVRGATTTAPKEEHKTIPHKVALLPMHPAIIRKQITIVKWLFNHGAKKDARTCNRSISLNPFAWCLSLKPPNHIRDPIRRHPDLAKCFILNGALDDDDGNIDVNTIKALINQRCSTSNHSRVTPSYAYEFVL